MQESIILRLIALEAVLRAATVGSTPRALPGSALSLARDASRARACVGTAPAQPAATGAHPAHSAASPPVPPAPASATPVHFAGETLNGQRLIEFRLGQEEREAGLSVSSAEVVVRAESSARGPRARYSLWAFVVSENGTVGALAGAARAGRARWQRLDVTAAARAWAGRGPLRLLLDCSGCAGRVRLRLGGGMTARPLLRLRLAAPAARRRRALDCDAAAHGRCCRQTYYVSFRALGWDDWIVAPEGYYANYCRGACAPMLSYHAQVVEAARVERAACCAPVRFSALSLIYFGADSNIIKRDLPEMVVEECACP